MYFVDVGIRGSGLERTDLPMWFENSERTASRGFKSFIQLSYKKEENSRGTTDLGSPRQFGQL